MRSGRELRGRSRRGSGWRAVVAVAAVTAVFFASATDTFSALRFTLLRLWNADWSELLAEPAAEGLDEAELRARILGILNDPALRPEGAVRAEPYRFEGCTLVLEVARDPAVCEAEPETGIASAGERIQLRNLLTDPGFVADQGTLVAVRGGRDFAEQVAFPWVPRIEAMLQNEIETYVLFDPPTLREGGATPERVAFAKDVTERIEAGEVGTAILSNHRYYRLCDGSRVIEPLRERRATVFAAPTRRDELVALFHALGRGACPATGWLIDW